MPLTRIDRILCVPHGDLHVVEDRQFYTLNGENIGIVDARQLFQLANPGESAGLCYLLVFSDRSNRFGLVVDRFLGQQDLVVHPLDRRLGKIENISAGAILEDGSPVLILDVDDLVRSIDHLLTHGRLSKVWGHDAASCISRGHDEASCPHTGHREALILSPKRLSL
jgi:two-component system sensor histidine kinase and response regulator WspE